MTKQYDLPIDADPCLHDAMDYPMRSDLRTGNKFPDFQLPDHTGEPRKLSQLLRGFPGVLNLHAPVSIPENLEIEFLDYDRTVNDRCRGERGP